MSERLTGEIWIGGAIKPDQAPELCTAIRSQQLSLEWGDASFEPHDAEQLLEGLDDLDGASVLHFCNDQANWGQFAELEEFLREHHLSYARRTGSSDCYDGALVEFRPGRELVILTTNANGHPVAEMEIVEKAWYLLKEAQQSLRQGKNVLGQLDQAIQLLAGLIPPELPPLPPFVVESSV
jgi:hypothetical protein